MTTDENNREAQRDLSDERAALVSEISRLRYARHEVTYKLEQAVRERDRLARHVASQSLGEEGAV
jgi:hypothetical protein